MGGGGAAYLHLARAVGCAHGHGSVAHAGQCAGVYIVARGVLYLRTLRFNVAGQVSIRNLTVARTHASSMDIDVYKRNQRRHADIHTCASVQTPAD